MRLQGFVLSLWLLGSAAAAASEPAPASARLPRAFSNAADTVRVAQHFEQVVASIYLPAGKYYLSVKGAIDNQSNAQLAVACGLDARGSYAPARGDFGVDYLSLTLEPKRRVPLSLHAVHAFTGKSPSLLTLRCRSGIPHYPSHPATTIPPVFARWIRLTALEVAP